MPSGPKNHLREDSEVTLRTGRLPGSVVKNQARVPPNPRMLAAAPSPRTALAPPGE